MGTVSYWIWEWGQPVIGYGIGYYNLNLCTWGVSWIYKEEEEGRKGEREEERRELQTSSMGWY